MKRIAGLAALIAALSFASVAQADGDIAERYRVLRLLNQYCLSPDRTSEQRYALAGMRALDPAGWETLPGGLRDRANMVADRGLRGCRGYRAS